jgi:hypothetical protein
MVTLFFRRRVFFLSLFFNNPMSHNHGCLFLQNLFKPDSGFCTATVFPSTQLEVGRAWFFGLGSGSDFINPSQPEGLGFVWASLSKLGLNHAPTLALLNKWKSRAWARARLTPTPNPLMSSWNDPTSRAWQKSVKKGKNNFFQGGGIFCQVGLAGSN